MIDFAQAPTAVLQRLRALRSGDMPTHGGRLLSYVYDAGLAEVDALTAEAANEVLHLNGLDPFVFGSIAVMERETVAFVRDLLHGDDQVVGSVTSGGTESIILAVRSARDRNPGKRRILAPTTRHAAFAKAAELLDMEIDTVPVLPTGAVDVAQFVERLTSEYALVVLSAPSYSYGALDPVSQIAPIAHELGVDVHVDACVGALSLPFWNTPLKWDFAVEGVTSMSADVHKYGFAPKGCSVVLFRGRDRHRASMFADLDWPGYPVVTSTLLGSRQPAGLAAGWATLSALGADGYEALQQRCRDARDTVIAEFDGINGLRVIGAPAGPVFAVGADAASSVPISPLLFVDALAAEGFAAQHQLGYEQPDGTRLPVSAHFTITPVTTELLPELLPALHRAADAARTATLAAAADADALETALAQLQTLPEHVDSDTAAKLLATLGALPERGEHDGQLRTNMAELMTLMDAAPRATVQRLLIELLARHLEP